MPVGFYIGKKTNGTINPAPFAMFYNNVVKYGFNHWRRPTSSKCPPWQSNLMS